MCTHTHTGEYSTAITRSIPSYCHSHLLPFLITAHLPDSPSPLPPLQPSFFFFFSLLLSSPLDYSPAPIYSSSTFCPSTLTERNSWGCNWVRRQVGLHASTPLWCAPSWQHVGRLIAGHQVVSIHLVWLKRKVFSSHMRTRGPELDCTCLFFSPFWIFEKWINRKYHLLHFWYSTSNAALSARASLPDSSREG